MSKSNMVQEANGVHPWRRFFARTFDVVVIGSVIAFFIFLAVGIFFPALASFFHPLLNNYILICVIAYLLWIPFEAVQVSIFGRTLGKAIFGIRILDTNGKRISFFSSLKRSFSVFVYGDGFGLPLVTFFTRFYQYRQLNKNGKTSWDEIAGSEVFCEKFGLIRYCIVTIIMGFSMSFIALLNLVSQ